MLADWYPSARALYLHAALSSGLLHALRSPCTREELVVDLDARREELLDGLLAEGLAWRELAERGGRYRLRGRRSRALVTEIGDPYAALIQESSSYHGSAYDAIGERMRGAPLGDYLTETGGLIARSSRMIEPPTAAFLHRCLREVRPSSVIDIGCGSGTYLRQAATFSPQLRGVGVEMSEEAAQLAAANLHRWGLGERCRVESGDILKLGALKEAPFDVAMLFHNVYYFDPTVRSSLFETIGSLLAPKGAIVLVSYFQGPSRVATHFDVVLRSTAGNTPLPTIDDTMAQLRSSGFEPARAKQLLPRESLLGVLARKV